MSSLGHGNAPPGRAKARRGGQESCCSALTSPLNFKVGLPWGMLGRGGDLASTLLLSAVCSAAVTALGGGGGEQKMSERPGTCSSFWGSWDRTDAGQALPWDLSHQPPPF